MYVFDNLIVNITNNLYIIVVYEFKVSFLICLNDTKKGSKFVRNDFVNFYQLILAIELSSIDFCLGTNIK